MENCKPIPGYEKYFHVSDLGNVYDVVNKSIKKLSIARTGYVVCNLHKKTFYVHRLVIMAFVGEIPIGSNVNHINGDKQNNTCVNLEILSFSDNHLHAFKVLKRKPTSLGKFGKDHCRSKPVDQCRLDGTIIQSFENARIANKATGISYKNISSCCNGERKSSRGFIWKFSALV